LSAILKSSSAFKIFNTNLSKKKISVKCDNNQFSDIRKMYLFIMSLEHVQTSLLVKKIRNILCHIKVRKTVLWEIL